MIWRLAQKLLVDSALVHFQFYNGNIAETYDILDTENDKEEDDNGAHEEESQEHSKEKASNYLPSESDTNLSCEPVRYETKFFEREVQNLKRIASYSELLRDSSDGNEVVDN